MPATTDTLIVGAGQAGLALSRRLAAAGVDHVLLERGRVGERWRSERWDALRLLTPSWLNVLPGTTVDGDPDGFAGARAFAGRLDAYARSFGAPVAERAAVRALEPARGGYRARTTAGAWRARTVVIATGDSDVPRIPAAARDAPRGLRQVAAAAYRSPAALPPGGVLVVGAGPSGQQIALELLRAGRPVVLAVGRHARAVRRHRGRDIFAWLVAMGDLERRIDEVPDPDAARRAPSMPLTGARAGERLDLGVLAAAGAVVTGRLTGFHGSRALFAGDRDAAVDAAEARLRRTLARIEDHIAARGLAVPDADAVAALALPPAPAAVDLARAGIATVIWATGYRRAYPWLRVPVLGADGELRQRGGVTTSPGLFTLGLRFQRRRGSHLIGGVGADAAVLGDVIVDRLAGQDRRRTAARRARARLDAAAATG